MEAYTFSRKDSIWDILGNLIIGQHKSLYVGNSSKAISLLKIILNNKNKVNVTYINLYGFMIRNYEDANFFSIFLLKYDKLLGINISGSYFNGHQIIYDALSNAHNIKRISAGYLDNYSTDKIIGTVINMKNLTDLDLYKNKISYENLKKVLDFSISIESNIKYIRFYRTDVLCDVDYICDVLGRHTRPIILNFAICYASSYTLSKLLSLVRSNHFISIENIGDYEQLEDYVGGYEEWAKHNSYIYEDEEYYIQYPPFSELFVFIPFDIYNKWENVNNLYVEQWQSQNISLNNEWSRLNGELYAYWESTNRELYGNSIERYNDLPFVIPKDICKKMRHDTMYKDWEEGYEDFKTICEIKTISKKNMSQQNF